MFFGVAAFAAIATASVLLGGIEPRKHRPKQAEEVRAPGGFWAAISGGLMLILRNTWQVRLGWLGCASLGMKLTTAVPTNHQHRPTCCNCICTAGPHQHRGPLP